MKKNTLADKSILICRPRKRCADLVSELKVHGAWPLVFPTAKIQILQPNKIIEHTLEQLPKFQWLAFGSSSGIESLLHFQKIYNQHIPIKVLHTGIVGKKTHQMWCQHFPAYSPRLTAHNMQNLLEKIASCEAAPHCKILNPTSVQSLSRISLAVPSRLELQRIPLYTTIPATEHSQQQIRDISNGKFHAIIFGSPTTFDYFLEIVGAAPLQKSVIATLGQTTTGHIQNKGFAVEVTPVEPTVAKTIEALQQYFAKQG